ncbi:HCc2 [Symbiodinium natans]|uniref:HCc2 protein n=1 Tax=Symbiodinium natans TaxID=878477 RepID=A0A812R5N0_9DINO|nr:HCc2 [Symbiodinium natans]
MTSIMATMEIVLGRNPAMLKFAAWFIIWMMSSIVYLPVSIPSFFSFRMKFQSHQLMLSQMANFDVRAAKCTVHADRLAIEHQVTELFRFRDELHAEDWPPSSTEHGEIYLQKCHPLEQSGSDPLGRFNEYVRGPLREFVIAQIGNELYVPWRICLVAFLPMIFYSSVNVLGCDNGPCEESAELAGYSSERVSVSKKRKPAYKRSFDIYTNCIGGHEYMLVQTVGWTLCILAAFPLTYPTLLRMVRFVLSHGQGPLQLAVAFLCCPLAYLYSYLCGSLIWGSLVSLVENYSRVQLGLFLVIMVFLAIQVSCLFSTGSKHEQASASCRCTQRQETAYEFAGLRLPS